ncbi:hypothetical protein ACGFS9_21290 [Streptomyces sp. NPDC048566]|uniref:hypothetical protein n=1 Tax=Streptomyces sp. NPDC048566 TaxID=3365569 RepID=UPI00371191AB
MAERTDARTPTGEATGYGWCHWHRGHSQTARLIQIIEQASGPGAGLYACAPCREQRGLTAYSDRP